MRKDMKEINRTLAVYEQIDLTQRKVGLATVVYVEGAAYRRPGARMLVTDNAEAVTDKLSVTDQTAAVLMSHNYNCDLAVLTRLLATNVPYIGMPGPRKRYEKMKTHWERVGHSFAPSTLKRVRSPIGLDLGAETPDEIALSILSDVKAFFSQRSAGFLTNRAGPIHDRVNTSLNAIAL